MRPARRGQSGKAGQPRDRWASSSSRSFSLLDCVRGSRCEPSACVCRTAFGAAEGTKQRKGRARFSRARHAVERVRQERTQPDPSFLPSRGSCLLSWSLGNQRQDVPELGGLHTSHVIGLQKSPVGTVWKRSWREPCLSRPLQGN